MDRHDQDLRSAFDGQAERFERSPVQTDPQALARLVAFAALPPGALILDAGCGPGLVSEAFLADGHRVDGVDLSGEMIGRARTRCARFGDSARFEEGSLFDLPLRPRYDAAVSRYVVHHVEDPLAFVRRQAALLRPGGVLLICDQTGDPDPERLCWHQEIERARDRSHMRHLTLGGLVDLLAAVGLADIRAAEEPFPLDFDEWFDRGTPADEKAAVRTRLLGGTARGFAPEAQPDGRVRIVTLRALVRGVLPSMTTASPLKRSPRGAPTFVALLRGVNVGGKNRLPMKELAAVFEGAGCGDVRTHIQSGNVLFAAVPAKAARIPALVSKGIRERFGFDAPVIVRSATELEAVADGNPFLRAGEDPAKLHVAFLADAPQAAAAAGLDRDRSRPDAFEVLGREVYLHLPNGVARTRLTNDWLDRALGTTCTVRSWRTVLELLRLARG